jgi:peptidoglycan/xylan/chitin deacetylase (PgdA/CDA1 family)
MKGRSLFERLPGAYARRMAKWFGRRPFTLATAEPIISFTFDDFPRSALLAAGSLLEQSAAGGTYFSSLGLMGKQTATGAIFQADDLPFLASRGHELGCHTFHHSPAWGTRPAEYASSVAQNLIGLAKTSPHLQIQTHSYPISYPRPKTKRRIQHRFRACRGGGQTFNHGTVDLNYLNSFFIEQSRDDFTTIEQTIVANAHAGGWLIFSTHDVCNNPSRFGCTPAVFEKVVQSSIRSGARILTMTLALDELAVPPLPYPKS